MNMMVRDATGRRRLKIHPKCVNTIRDMKFLLYKEGSDNVDKTSDPERSHASDALGYCIMGAMAPLLPQKHQIGNLMNLRGIA